MACQAGGDCAGQLLPHLHDGGCLLQQGPGCLCGDLDSLADNRGNSVHALLDDRGGNLIALLCDLDTSTNQLQGGLGTSASSLVVLLQDGSTQAHVST